MKIEVITAEILSGLEQLGEAPALSFDGHKWSGNQVLAWTKAVAENLSEQLDILQGKALLLPANSCEEAVRLLLHLVALRLGIGFETEAPTNAEGKPLAIKEPLNNSVMPLACRAVHNQGAASQECLDLSRSRNAECESLCKPRRAGLEGRTCCVAALAKGYGHSRRAAPNICSLQDPQRYYGVIQRLLQVQTPDLLGVVQEELSLLLIDKGMIEADTAEANFTLYKSQQESLRALQGRVGVFSPLNKFARFAIFAAWSCGLAVYLQSPEINPAKALVILERSGCSGVILLATLLKGLVAHPAIALTNLKNLQCLLYETEVLLPQPLLQNARRLLASEIAGWVCSETSIEPVAKAEQALTQKLEAITESVATHPAVANSFTVPLTGGDRWAVFAQAKVQEKIRDKPGMPDMAGLFEGINTELDTEFAHIDLEHAVKVTEQLNATALLSMLNAFSHLGLFCEQHSVHSLAEILETPPVAQQHQALIKRWIRVLQEQQLLSADGDSWRVEVDSDSYSDTSLAQAWDQLEQDWRALSGASKTIDYARANAEQLPDLIRGKVQAVHLLFPRGSTELASALYREGIAARYQQHAVSALLKSILNSWEEQPQPLKILEVGAGTGATTQALLPVLDDASDHIQFDYQFTDISSAFLDSFFAQHGDQEQRPWLHRDLFDIDRPLRSQGFSPNSFDVIIAGGVFNAAHNTDASLRRVAELLRPGGWFIMTEPTSEEFWVMASQAFMLVDAVDERTDSGATFLSLSQWHNALEAAGLELAMDLPVSEHPLSRQGHRFFACRAKQHQMRLSADCLAEYIDHFDSEIYIQVLDQLPLTLEGQIDKDQLEKWAVSMAENRGESNGN